MKLFDQFCMAILFYRGQMYINSLLIKARLKKILNFFYPITFVLHSMARQ